MADKSSVEHLQWVLAGEEAVLMPSRSHDEVWENLFVSEAEPARHPEELHRQGFTHILNCSQGTGFGKLNTTEADYEPHSIAFLGLCVADSERSNLFQFFESAAEFIHSALSKDGKILVHCMEGFSRSPSISAAYLMKYQNMTAENALKQIRSKREVYPNPGFLRQLLKWEESLKGSA